MILSKIKNKILFLFLLFLICFNYSNSIGFVEVKDDNVDYLKYSLNFAIHNKQSRGSHQDQKVIFDDERSAGYPFINSLLLKNDKNKLIKKNINCFIKGQDEFCKKTIEKLQTINFIFYVIIILSIIFITFTFTKSLFYSLLISILFSINSFFILNISLIGPEIISALVILWLSYSTFKFYQNENYFNQALLIFFSAIAYLLKPAFIFYFLFIFITNIFLDMKFHKSFKKKSLNILIIFILSISPVLFIKSISYKQIKKVTNISPLIVQIKENYYKKYSINKMSNNLKDYNNHDNFLPDNTGGEVFLARAVYGFIRWDEIIPLIISFLPRGSDYLFDKFYESEEIERIKPGASFEGRNRNFFLIYRKYISEDYLLNKGYDLSSLNTLQKSTIVYFDNIFKQIFLTPIFTIRGIMAPTNFSIIVERFDDNLLSKIYKVFALITFIIQFFGLLFMLCFFIKYLFSKKNYSYIYFIIAPAYSIFFHSVFTHYIPRYSQPLAAVAYIFLAILLYRIMKDKKKI